MHHNRIQNCDAGSQIAGAATRILPTIFTRTSRPWASIAASGHVCASRTTCSRTSRTPEVQLPSIRASAARGRLQQARRGVHFRLLGSRRLPRRGMRRNGTLRLRSRAQRNGLGRGCRHRARWLRQADGPRSTLSVAGVLAGSAPPGLGGELPAGSGNVGATAVAGDDCPRRAPAKRRETPRKPRGEDVRRGSSGT